MADAKGDLADEAPVIWNKQELTERLGDDPQMICLLMQRFFEDLNLLMADLRIAVSYKEHADVKKRLTRLKVWHVLCLLVRLAKKPLSLS